MVVAECPKIFDFQCIWGRIFVSLENIFVFKYFCMENVLQKLFWHIFLGTHTIQIVPKYIWMRNCDIKIGSSNPCVKYVVNVDIDHLVQVNTPKSMLSNKFS